MLKNRNIIKKVFFICFILFCFSPCISQGAINRAPTVDYKSQSLFTNNCRVENKQSVVEKVFDGDTILVENGGKIRLLGIDAFEHDQNIYGMKGKDFLSMLVLNKKVCIETDVQKNDIYGRTLGYVFINNLFVNEVVVKNGLAILYDFPPNTKYIYRLKKAQSYGRENMLGIWERQNFILETPSQWRHEHPFNKNRVKIFNKSKAVLQN